MKNNQENYQPHAIKLYKTVAISFLKMNDINANLRNQKIKMRIQKSLVDDYNLCSKFIIEWFFSRKYEELIEHLCKYDVLVP